jgi:hypothetical protein
LSLRKKGKRDLGDMTLGVLMPGMILRYRLVRSQFRLTRERMHHMIKSSRPLNGNYTVAHGEP